MASSPIISWQIDGETVADFIFGVSKITTNSDCSHKIKRCLLLERKVMTNRDSISKVHLVKAMVFPAVMYRCESWTIKKAGCWRIDAFELWCWRRCLKSPLDCKEIQPVHPKGNQSWVFIGRTDAEAEALILWRSNTWCEELTHLKRSWCWERSKAGGEGEDRGWNSGMASLMQWTWVWASSESWWWTGKPGMRQSMGLQRVGYDWTAELNWN